MAGHSQFKNIMYRKGAQDKKRAKLFAKLIREVTVAAKSGLPDPDLNPRLRAAVSAARGANMPKDNIERAIKRVAGGEEDSNFEEIRYEGYGPGGAAIIVETVTDNRNRTASEVRAAFSKYGGVVWGRPIASPSCLTMSASILLGAGWRAMRETKCSRRRSRPARKTSSPTSRRPRDPVCGGGLSPAVRDAITERFGDPREART